MDQELNHNSYQKDSTIKQIIMIKPNVMNNGITQIGSKFYQKSKVIILPIDFASNTEMICKTKDGLNIGTCLNTRVKSSNNLQMFHLYLLSDEVLKIIDYCWGYKNESIQTKNEWIKQNI